MSAAKTKVKKNDKDYVRVPSRNFRLADPLLTDLDRIAEYYRLESRTDAVRFAIGAALREMVEISPKNSRPKS
jgi:hypothetical protein